MSLKEHIYADIIKLTLNNKEKSEIYSYLSDKYSLNRKRVSAYYLQWSNEDQKVECNFTTAGNAEIFVNDYSPINLSKKKIQKIVEQKGEDLHVTVNLDFEVRSLEDLLVACDVDGKKWEVKAWQCKKWDLGIKNAQEKIETKQLFSVSASFSPRKLDNDLNQQREVIVKQLFESAPSNPLTFACKPENPTADCVLELALFDVHFGKLAHREESGDDYDLKIAMTRYKDAIKELLSRIDLNCIQRILLPIGNDMINVDNNQSTTTAGTLQDCDSRFYKIIRSVKSLLIETINSLAVIAPVDVVVVAGNHDELSSFMIGEMLSAYYHNTERVVVDNGAAFRKYYKFGTVSIMFTHGNKEKHADLGMIFAAENPLLWAATTQRYIQLGHYHHNKKINYLSNQEFQGFQTQIMPSLSGSDAWHSGKGFNSLKQAKALLFHKKNGLIGEFTHTVK